MTDLDAGHMTSMNARVPLWGQPASAGSASQVMLSALRPPVLRMHWQGTPQALCLSAVAPPGASCADRLQLVFPHSSLCCNMNTVQACAQLHASQASSALQGVEAVLDSTPLSSRIQTPRRSVGAGSASRHRVQVPAATPCSAVGRQAPAAAAVTPGTEPVLTSQANQPGGPAPSWLAERAISCRSA